MKLFRRGLALLLALSVLGAVTLASAAELPDDLEGAVVIIHTNDVHGSVDGYAKAAAMKTAYEAYGDQIHFVMVNVGDAMQGETREKADAYLEESGFTFPVYFDLDYQGITAYGVTGFPHTYFVDGAGNLQLYAPGMISAAGLQQGLHAIAPELVPAPPEA